MIRGVVHVHGSALGHQSREAQTQACTLYSEQLHVVWQD